VRFLERDGTEVKLEATGLLAVCIQHEVDHLDGKLFVDYLSEAKRQRIRKKLLKERFDEVGGDYEMSVRVAGEPFFFPPGALSNLVADAVKKTTGRTPEFSTTGGTSDARFIKDHCPVCEFGMSNQTAHKADENALIADVRTLADIYEAVLDGFFAGPG